MTAFRGDGSPTKQSMVSYNHDIMIINDSYKYAIEPDGEGNKKVVVALYKKEDGKEFITPTEGMQHNHFKLLFSNVVLKKKDNHYILEPNVGMLSWNRFRALIYRDYPGRYAFASQLFEGIHSWNPESLAKRGLNYAVSVPELNDGDSNRQYLETLTTNKELAKILQDYPSDEVRSDDASALIQNLSLGQT